MKTYHNLKNDLEWIDLITTIDSNQYTFLDSNNGDYIFAWDSEDHLIQAKFKSESLLDFENKYANQYLFGYLGYDAKNEYYKSEKSTNPDFHQLPESIFYVPKHVILKKNGNLLYFGTQEGYQEFISIEFIKNTSNVTHQSIKLICNTNFNEYKNNIDSIHNHLQQGNIYEINYCINFTATNCKLDIIESFKKLKQNTKAPFSTLF